MESCESECAYCGCNLTGKPVKRYQCDNYCELCCPKAQAIDQKMHMNSQIEFAKKQEIPFYTHPMRDLVLDNPPKDVRRRIRQQAPALPALPTNPTLAVGFCTLCEGFLTREEGYVCYQYQEYCFDCWDKIKP